MAAGQNYRRPHQSYSLADILTITDTDQLPEAGVKAPTLELVEVEAVPVAPGADLPPINAVEESSLESVDDVSKDEEATLYLSEGLATDSTDLEAVYEAPEPLTETTELAGAEEREDVLSADLAEAFVQAVSDVEGNDAPEDELALPLGEPIDALPHVDVSVEATSDKPEPEAAVDDIDIDPELLEIFMEEASELLESIEESVHEWEGEPDNSEHSEELKRLLHTLKGGARLSGMTMLGDVAHDFETYLIEMGDGFVPDASSQQKIHTYLDAILHGITQAQQLLAGEISVDQLRAVTRLTIPTCQQNQLRKLLIQRRILWKQKRSRSRSQRSRSRNFIEAPRARRNTGS